MWDWAAASLLETPCFFATADMRRVPSMPDKRGHTPCPPADSSPRLPGNVTVASEPGGPDPMRELNITVAAPAGQASLVDLGLLDGALERRAANASTSMFSAGGAGDAVTTRRTANGARATMPYVDQLAVDETAAFFMAQMAALVSNASIPCGSNVTVAGHSTGPTRFACFGTGIVRPLPALCCTPRPPSPKPKPPSPTPPGPIVPLECTNDRLYGIDIQCCRNNNQCRAASCRGNGLTENNAGLNCIANFCGSELKCISFTPGCRGFCLGTVSCANGVWLDTVRPGSPPGCLAELRGKICIQRNSDPNLPYDVCGGGCWMAGPVSLLPSLACS
jgi:hypothetical protein